MSELISDDLPLKGVRVIDLTQALAGPFAAMILGDLGAEILKVEPPKGDLTRAAPPYFIEGASLFYLTNNRNKLSIAIDLKNNDGKKVLYDLVKTGDVVFYNFSAGVAERLGVDHKTLLEINPTIITCEVTGYGRRGAGVNRPMVDVVAQSLAGAMSITGEAGRPPVRAGVATADLSTGLYSCIGILAALHSRGRNGRGAKVETSLFHSQLSLLNYTASFNRYSGEVPPPVGSGHVSNAVAQAFPTRDGWITIDAAFNNHFVSLCDALGRPDLPKDVRYVDRPSRTINRVELTAILVDCFKQRTTAEWLDLLSGRGFPIAPVNNVAQALAYAQVAEYNALAKLPFKNAEIEVLRTPIWFDDRREHPMRSPPELGEHTQHVLKTLLGYDDDKIARLTELGAIGATAAAV